MKVSWSTPGTTTLVVAWSARLPGTEREDEPDAIGLDASLRQPGAPMVGDGRIASNQPFHLHSRNASHAARSVVCQGSRPIFHPQANSPGEFRTLPSCRGTDF